MIMSKLATPRPTVADVFPESPSAFYVRFIYILIILSREFFYYHLLRDSEIGP
jgi:hypothetical protein